jgi:hypothetical protein
MAPVTYIQSIFLPSAVNKPESYLGPCVIVHESKYL